MEDCSSQKTGQQNHPSLSHQTYAAVVAAVVAAGDATAAVVETAAAVAVAARGRWGEGEGGEIGRGWKC